MRKIILALLALGTLFLLGCGTTYYVCPNGDKVTNPEECGAAETASTSATQAKCSPSSMKDRCEGSSLFHDYACVNGEWQHSTTQCEYGCDLGACVQPECPNCDDENECTADSCSAQTNYECVHTPLTNSGCIDGEKLCFPTPLPSDSTYARVAFYETQENLNKDMQMGMGYLALGESSGMLSGASVRLETIVASGACAFCGDTPRVGSTMQAKFVVPAYSKVGLEQTLLLNEGQSLKFCVEGECVAEGGNPCASLECSNYNWVKVQEISVGKWTCS